eukprot:COSAG02_NODE_4_length_69935_cov_46.806590_18_plen_130_part_00
MIVIEFIAVYTSMLAATSMTFAVIAAATFAFATQIIQLALPELPLLDSGHDLFCSRPRSTVPSVALLSVHEAAFASHAACPLSLVGSSSQQLPSPSYAVMEGIQVKMVRILHFHYGSTSQPPELALRLR